jgi:hypothetical protein
VESPDTEDNAVRVYLAKPAHPDGVAGEGGRYFGGRKAHKSEVLEDRRMKKEACIIKVIGGIVIVLLLFGLVGLVIAALKTVPCLFASSDIIASAVGAIGIIVAALIAAVATVPSLESLKETQIAKKETALLERRKYEACKVYQAFSKYCIKKGRAVFNVLSSFVDDDVIGEIKQIDNEENGDGWEIATASLKNGNIVKAVIFPKGKIIESFMNAANGYDIHSVEG